MRYSTKSSRRGVAAVFLAVCLTAILGVTAIALDGGVLMDDRRQVQATADATALAAADSLFAHYAADQGTDPSGLAKSQAVSVASANGYTNGTNATVTVNIPPLTGPHQGKASYAEVVIEYPQKRFFSKLWGDSDITVRARAVARGCWIPFNNGILILDPTLPSALNNTGNGSINVKGAPVIVNSDAPDAANSTGNGVVSAPDLYITGVPGTSGSGQFISTIHNGVPPTPDPLAYLPEPNPAEMTLQSNNKVQVSGNQTKTIQPGVYKGGINVTGQATLIMSPGIYYMDGGGFTFEGQGNLSAPGVMIFNAPNANSHKISISGTGSMQLSPPTTGIYQGLSLFQERSSTNTVEISGNGASNLTGAFYCANGELSVTGNGTQNVLGSQYISNTLKLGGNGNFTIDWNPDAVPKIRILGLVE